MERSLGEECCPEQLVEAAIVPGSNYRGAYRVGARIALELEAATGRVIVTRAKGAVKIAYLIGPHAETIAFSLRVGYRYSGQVVDIALGLPGKVLHLQLDPPGR